MGTYAKREASWNITCVHSAETLSEASFQDSGVTANTYEWIEDAGYPVGVASDYDEQKLQLGLRN